MCLQSAYSSRKFPKRISTQDSTEPVHAPKILSSPCLIESVISTKELAFPTVGQERLRLSSSASTGAYLSSKCLQQTHWAKELHSSDKHRQTFRLSLTGSLWNSNHDIITADSDLGFVLSSTTFMRIFTSLQRALTCDLSQEALASGSLSRWSTPTSRKITRASRARKGASSWRTSKTELY